MEDVRRIYVSGTFDCLHSGHIKLFLEAKKLGTVIAAVNTDEFVEEYKRKPLMPFNERMTVLCHLDCVDEVVTNFGGKDSKPSILFSKATHILHGDDWTGESLMAQMGLTQEWLDEHKIKMLYVPYTKGISTTQIISRLRN